MSNQSSSTFATVGPDGPPVENASAVSSARYSTPRHAVRGDGGRFAALPHRQPVEVDATTGQRLADDDEGRLQRAAARAGAPTMPRYRGEAEGHADRQATLSATLDIHDAACPGARDALAALFGVTGGAL